MLPKLLTISLLTLVVEIAVRQAQPPSDVFEVVLASDRTRSLLTSFLLPEAYHADDPSTLSRALDALRHTDDRKATNAVRALLEHTDPAVRAEALISLETMLPPPELLPVLRRGCQDESDQVAQHALTILGRLLGSDADRELADVFEDVSARASSVRISWANALARRREPPPERILSAMICESEPVIRLAASTIVERHPQLLPLPQRMELIDDKHPLVRASGIKALKQHMSETVSKEAIVQALDDPSPWVRRSALDILKQHPVRFDVVRKFLNDDDSTVRIAAIKVAVAVQIEDVDDVVEKLMERLSDSEVVVARVASEQLGMLPKQSVEAVLIQQLDSTNDQVVVQAARALGVMKGTSALEPLRTLSTHASAQVREKAYEAIGRLADKGLVPWLLEQAAKETGYPRATINAALGSIGDRRCVDHLLADCHYPDKKSKGINPTLFPIMTGPPAPPLWPGPYRAVDTAVATAAVRALGELGEPRAFETLAALSRDVLRNSGFWSAVAWSLGQLGHSGAGTALAYLAVDGQITQNQKTVDISDSTRIEALRAIGTLRLSGLTEQILKTDGVRCSVLVRKAAAKVLTALTGRTYTYRQPVRMSHFFLEDNSVASDLSALKTPICYVKTD